MPVLERVSLPTPTYLYALSDECMFLFDQPNPHFDSAVRTPEKFAEDLVDFSDIRCPLCAWAPMPSDRWFCAPCDHPENFADGCGACWNTFISHGHCPRCGHRWRWTACLRCGCWSLHENWYKNQAQNRH